MKVSFASLWNSNGVVSRGTYALIGFAGSAIKYNLDRAVALIGFNRH